MKRNTRELFFVLVSCIALIVALLAMRAWEVSDGINGSLLSALGKLFSFLPASQVQDGASFRADSIFAVTEARLIFLCNALAVVLSLSSIVGALIARQMFGPSAYYAAAVLISFGTCVVVQRGIAIFAAVVGVALVVVLNVFNKKRLIKHSTLRRKCVGHLSS